MILDDIDLDARRFVVGGFQRDKPEGRPKAGAGRQTHPRFEVAVLHAATLAGGIRGGEETGAPTAVWADARRDLQRSILERERSARPRIHETSIAEVAVPRRMRCPPCAIEPTRGYAQVAEVFGENRPE